MEDKWKKLRRWTHRLIEIIRCKLDTLESRFDEMPPHPLIGEGLVILGVLVFLAGLAMMILPVPGIITVDLGIALIVIGFVLAHEKYDPNKKLFEMDATCRRLEIEWHKKARTENRSNVINDEFKQ